MGTRNSLTITSRSGFPSSRSTGTMTTASALCSPTCGCFLREAKVQRPWWPLCSKVAAKRLTHFSLVSFSTFSTRMPLPSNRFGSALAGADADAVLQRQNEDFAVADAALGSGAARLHDGVDCRLHEVLVDGNLQLHLAQQVQGQLVASVDLRVAFLPAEALHVHDGQAENLNLVEGFLDRFELRRLDDGQN